MCVCGGGGYVLVCSILAFLEKGIHIFFALFVGEGVYFVKGKTLSLGFVWFPNLFNKSTFSGFFGFVYVW